MEKLIKHRNGQWSLTKNNSEPEEYRLPSGAVIKRSFRGQTADMADDQYIDNWTLHDENGIHLGNSTVYHGPSRRATHSVESGGTFGEWPSTMKRLPNGNADPESYEHYNFMARQYLPEITNQLASHYGEMSTNQDLDSKHVDPKHKYSNSSQSIAEMHGWKLRKYEGNDPKVIAYLKANHDRWAAMPKQTWHHVKSAGNSNVDYHALANDTSVSTGGLYEAPEHPGGKAAAVKELKPVKPKKTNLN